MEVIGLIITFIVGSIAGIFVISGFNKGTTISGIGDNIRRAGEDSTSIGGRVKDNDERIGNAQGELKEGGKRIDRIEEQQQGNIEAQHKLANLIGKGRKIVKELRNRDLNNKD